MTKLLLRMLVGLGFVGIIAGALAYALMLGLLYLTNIPPESIREIASAVAIAGALAGFYLDSKYQISAGIHRKIWLDEQEAARKLLRDGSVDHRQALEKYYNASYELSQIPNFFRRLLPVLSKNVSKEAHKDKLWIVQHVLLILPPEAFPTDRGDLSPWLPLVDELVSCLLAVRGGHDLFRRFISAPLNPERVAQEVLAEWHRRHSRERRPGDGEDPSGPRQLSGGAPIPADTFSSRAREPEKEKR